MFLAITGVHFLLFKRFEKFSEIYTQKVKGHLHHDIVMFSKNYFLTFNQAITQELKEGCEPNVWYNLLYFPSMDENQDKEPPFPSVVHHNIVDFSNYGFQVFVIAPCDEALHQSGLCCKNNHLKNICNNFC